MMSEEKSPFSVGSLNSDKYPDKKYFFRVVDCRKIPLTPDKKGKNIEFVIFIYDADHKDKETYVSLPKILEKIINENKINGFKVRAFISAESWNIFDSTEEQDKKIKYHSLLFAWDNDDKQVLEIRVNEKEDGADQKN